MKRRTKIIIVLLILVGGTSVAYALMSRTNSSDASNVRTVEVERGTLVDKALAVGRLEPEVEISVKSQFSGVVSRRYADVGDYVEAGTPLLEIRPNPTPTELVDARRQIELREIELENLQTEFQRQQQLLDRQLVSQQEYDTARRRYDEARLQVEMARERLELIEEGRVETHEGTFESIVRAPISGFILDKSVEIGDPIVPLSSYQEGTVLMTMADMETLILRGTVDEIDVGRLREQMLVDIKIGALPNVTLKGELTRIWLKAREEENSTVFPVEISLTQAPALDLEAGETPEQLVQLRAGYSANAEIIIESREDVLMIPERVVDFSGDSPIVTVMLESGTTEERSIQTGLSDAINIEVASGLSEGDKVVEPEIRMIGR